MFLLVVTNDGCVKLNLIQRKDEALKAFAIECYHSLDRERGTDPIRPQG